MWMSCDPSIRVHSSFQGYESFLRDKENVLKVTPSDDKASLISSAETVFIGTEMKDMKYPRIHIILEFFRSSERIIGHIYTIIF